MKKDKEQLDTHFLKAILMGKKRHLCYFLCYLANNTIQLLDHLIATPPSGIMRYGGFLLLRNMLQISHKIIKVKDGRGLVTY